jgi:hypothetical protein
VVPLYAIAGEVRRGEFLWSPSCNDEARSAIDTRGIDRGQGKKLEVVALIEPRALEGFDRQPRAPGQGHGIDGQLGDGALLFGRVSLVIEDVQIPCAQLQEVDVTRNGMRAKGKRKSTVLKVGKVLGREVDGDFHGNGGPSH